MSGGKGKENGEAKESANCKNIIKHIGRGEKMCGVVQKFNMSTVGTLVNCKK